MFANDNWNKNSRPSVENNFSLLIQLWNTLLNDDIQESKDICYAPIVNIRK